MIQRAWIVQSLDTYEFLCPDENAIIGFTQNIVKAGIFYEKESALESAIEEIGDKFVLFSFFTEIN